jgi:hypothetical protein
MGMIKVTLTMENHKMKIETQIVSELFYVLKQMMEENKGGYSVSFDDGEYVSLLRQARVNDKDKQLELFY